MIYVQYYYKRILSNGTDSYIEAMGDRSIVILDGRTGKGTWHRDALEYNGYRRPFYDAYRLFQGQSILRSHPITPVMPIGTTD